MSYDPNPPIVDPTEDYHGNYNKCAANQLMKLSDKYLRPAQLNVLVRLYTSFGLWVDARALGFISSSDQYDPYVDKLVYSSSLRVALSTIRNYLSGTRYKLETKHKNRRLIQVRMVDANSQIAC